MWDMAGVWGVEWQRANYRFLFVKCPSLSLSGNHFPTRNFPPSQPPPPFSMPSKFDNFSHKFQFSIDWFNTESVSGSAPPLSRLTSTATRRRWTRTWATATGGGITTILNQSRSWEVLEQKAILLYKLHYDCRSCQKNKIFHKSERLQLARFPYLGRK